VGRNAALESFACGWVVVALVSGVAGVTAAAQSARQQDWDHCIGVEALEDYDRAIELNPRYLIAIDNRGIVYVMLGQYDRAIEDFNAALQISPRTASSLYGRGVAKSKKGDMVGADADIAEALRLQPTVAEVMSPLER
jgi:tetratricopeptide (TPR) repeat protein